MKNQSGITLIELLGAITVATILFAITFNLLTSTVKYNEKTQAHINIRQEANAVITKMRTLHQQNEIICYDNLLSDSNVYFETFLLDSFPNDGLSEEDSFIGKCWPTEQMDKEPFLPIQVQFTIKSVEHDLKYELQTIIDSKHTVKKPADEGDFPPQEKLPEDSFFDFLSRNNMFVYGSNLFISGSTTINGNGAVVIYNSNKKDLIFTGDNRVTAPNIYLDKKGNEIIFNSSTHLGAIDSNQKMSTALIRIEGDVQLNNGGAQINAETIYIDGNVAFHDSAKIKGKHIIITGDVLFHHWSALLEAETIYIGGDIAYVHPGNIVGNVKHVNELEQEMIPKNIAAKQQPTFHEDIWYFTNGYEFRSTGKLFHNDRIFSDTDFISNEWHQNTENVVIISKGDITINNFGGSELTGILYAPNGTVTFKGERFKGIIISRDGIDTDQNPHIDFIPIGAFITEPSAAPFP